MHFGIFHLRDYTMLMIFVLFFCPLKILYSLCLVNYFFLLFSISYSIAYRPLLVTSFSNLYFFQYYVIYLYIYRQFLVDIILNHHRGLTISNFLFLIVYFFIQFMLVIMFFHFCHNLNVINYLLDGFRWYIFVIFRSR